MQCSPPTLLGSILSMERFPDAKVVSNYSPEVVIYRDKQSHEDTHHVQSDSSFSCMSMLVATHMHRALGSRSNQELWLSELCLELLSRLNIIMSMYVLLVS